MSSTLPKDQETYDPPAEERVWYEHIHHGDRGYMVVRRGKPAIHYDRPTDDWVVWRKNDWRPIREVRPLTPYFVGEIAYNADYNLNRRLGEKRGRKVEWGSLSKEDRIKWMSGAGPGEKAHHLRTRLFRYIVLALEKATA